MAAGRKTGGRQKGTPNKAKTEMVARAAANGMLPHELLLAVSQGQEIDGHLPTFEERVAAAEKAAPYYAPRLAAVEAKVTQRFDDMDRDELLEQIRVRAARVGLIGPLTRPQ